MPNAGTVLLSGDGTGKIGDAQCRHCFVVWGWDWENRRCPMPALFCCLGMGLGK